MAASGISLLRRGGALPQSSTCRNRRRGTEKQSSEVVIMSTTSSSLSSLPTPPSAPSPSPSASSAHSLRSRRPLRTPSTSLRSSGSEVLAPTPRKALLSNTERRPQATRKGAHKIERGARDIVTAASTFHNVPTTVAGSHAALTGTHRGVHAVWRDRRTHAVGRQRPGGITTLRGPLRTRARSGSGPSSSLPPSAIDLPSDDVLESDTEIGGIASHQPSGDLEASNGAVSAPSGMAEAFGISPRAAFGITALITCAAFALPLLLQTWAPTASTQVKSLSYLTMLLGFYMAWNIGANDVANAMGTSVGSGALSLRQAVVTAAVLEFGGAFLVGSHVSHTMQSGIVKADVFVGRQGTLFTGMLASLAASGTWLQVASFFGWPVSTTHCIIGAMVGFGLVYGGPGAVYWASLARVVSSWLISPLCGASIAYIVYRCIRQFVYDASNPGQAACRAAPVLVFLGVTAFSLSSLVTGGPLIWPILQSLAAGTIGAVIVSATIDRQLGEFLGDFCEIPGKVQVRRVTPKGPTGTQLKIVYVVFGYLQVLSACFMSFAHGANDVANAIGPILAALTILQGPHAAALPEGMATRVLVWGGFGIVAGLLVWGYRVIATIGGRITELTPTRGFAAEFSAATVVVVASRLGLPISATHTLVGAVMGVGLARGLGSVRFEVMKEIATSWVVTIPIGATLSVIYAAILQRIVPVAFF